jgi:N-acetylglutamate synthase-like GNAT family acetyltransferase
MTDSLDRYEVMRSVDITEIDLNELRELYAYLSSSVLADGTLFQVERMLRAPQNIALVARDRCTGLLAGCALLTIVDQITKRTGLINDVVVHPRDRNQGIGGLMLDRLLRSARDLGCRHVELTSSNARATANALYASRGFVRRDTNVLRLLLPHGSDPGVSTME